MPPSKESIQKWVQTPEGREVLENAAREARRPKWEKWRDMYFKEAVDV